MIQVHGVTRCVLVVLLGLLNLPQLIVSLCTEVVNDPSKKVDGKAHVNGKSCSSVSNFSHIVRAQ